MNKKLYLIMAILLGGTVWMLSQPSSKHNMENAANIPTPSFINQSKANINSPEQSPMHYSEEPPEPNKEPTKSIAIAEELKIKLLGTMISEKRSSAIIRLFPEKNQRMVFAGDVLGENIYLESIEKNAIMINHAGHLKRITLQWGKSTVTTLAPFLPLTPNKRNDSKLQQQSLKWQTTKQALKVLPVQNSRTLSEYKLLAPVTKKGKIKGYYAEDILPDALLDRMGLYHGDIVRQVNKIKLNSPQNISKAIGIMRQGEKFDIKLKRNGKSEKMHFGAE